MLTKCRVHDRWRNGVRCEVKEHIAAAERSSSGCNGTEDLRIA